MGLVVGGAGLGVLAGLGLGLDLLVLLRYICLGFVVYLRCE